MIKEPPNRAGTPNARSSAAGTSSRSKETGRSGPAKRETFTSTTSLHGALSQTREPTERSLLVSPPKKTSFSFTDSPALEVPRRDDEVTFDVASNLSDQVE